MKIRFFIAASSAVALLAAGTLVSAAQADVDPALEADVGGGAAGIVAELELHSYDLAPLFQNNDTTTLTVSQPRVAMGRNGGTSRFRVVSQSAAGVTAKVIEETVKGNRHGTPFAEASSTLVGVKITGGALKGTQLGTLTSYCKWDRSGVIASTHIVNANGTTSDPAVNETHDFPGVGYIVFNEQYTDSAYYKNAAGDYVLGPDGNYLYQEVVYVTAAHIHTEQPLVLADGSTTQDVLVGFTSCDPVKLPPLSGLTSFQTGD